LIANQGLLLQFANIWRGKSGNTYPNMGTPLAMEQTVQLSQRESKE
jgi:hypothetical protein